MKKFLLALVFLFLVGCGSTPVKTEIEYRPVYPPESLTRECYPDKPDRASIGGIIAIQDRALDQCNDQLEGIRNWRILETTPQKEKSNE